MDYDVLIVGGGQAGFQLAASLRMMGYGGTIGILADEDRLPYMRPPLSKAYMMGDAEEDDLTFRPQQALDADGIAVHRGLGGVAIDRSGRRVGVRSGETVGYGVLVLATGARPRPAPGLDGHANVFALRSLADAEAVRSALERARHVTVIGGGFIGLEFAGVARKAGKDVCVIEAGARLMGRAVSPFMSNWYLALHRQRGVDVRLGTTVDGAEADGGRVRALTLSDGATISTDMVVVGIGVIPNCELAAKAGLAIDNGICVDHRLATSDPSIFAIGDCAAFIGPDGVRRRLESVQNAVDHAKFLAGSLSGQPLGAYGAVPWFWTEQFDTKLQMAGLQDGYDDLSISGDVGEASFTVRYFRAGQLVAVDSVNQPRTHLAARRELAELYVKAVA